jgi:hypothetical protein
VSDALYLAQRLYFSRYSTKIIAGEKLASNAETFFRPLPFPIYREPVSAIRKRQGLFVYRKSRTGGFMLKRTIYAIIIFSLFPLLTSMAQTGKPGYSIEYTGRMHNGYYWREIEQSDSTESARWHKAANDSTTSLVGLFTFKYLNGTFDEILSAMLNDNSIIDSGRAIAMQVYATPTEKNEGASPLVAAEITKYNTQIIFLNQLDSELANLRGNCYSNGVADGEIGLSAMGLAKAKEMIPPTYPNPNSKYPNELIDEFYGDAKNRSVPIFFASEYCLWRKNGAAERELQAFLSILRTKSSAMHAPDKRMTKW